MSSELGLVSAQALAMITSSALVMARALGLILVMPFFVRLGLTGIVRFSVALAFCLPILPALSSHIGPEQASLTTALLSIKELVIGVTIGIALGVPLWAAEIAGDLLDLQRGSTAAQLFDPGSVTESSVTATFFSLSTMLIFASSGGVMVTLDSLYKSYAIWPINEFSPLLADQSAILLLGTLDRLLGIAVLLVAPLILALLVTDVMLAFLSRIAPQLHVFDLSLSIKNLLFALLIVLYAAFLLPMIQTEVSRLSETKSWLQELAVPTITRSDQP